MAFYTYTKIAGLSSTLIVLRKLCQLIAKYNANIRDIIPEEHQAAYDNWITGTALICAVIEGAARALITPA